MSVNQESRIAALLGSLVFGFEDTVEVRLRTAAVPLLTYLSFEDRQWIRWHDGKNNSIG